MKKYKTTGELPVTLTIDKPIRERIRSLKDALGYTWNDTLIFMLENVDRQKENRQLMKTINDYLEEVCKLHVPEYEDDFIRLSDAKQAMTELVDSAPDSITIDLGYLKHGTTINNQWKEKVKS